MNVLILNDHGPLVTLLQERLQRAGYKIVITDQFDEPTAHAVMKLQRDSGLVIDAIVGPKTQSALLQRSTAHLLSHDQILAAAAALSVDVASVFAIKNVESRGEGFLEDGRPVILYERHVMLKRLKANGLTPTVVNTALLRYPTLINKRPGAYKGGASEHYRLTLASSIHRTSALESCSWGLFQIMGYHWKALGYSSVDYFVTCMHSSEGEQLTAFVKFIINDSKLHTALKQQNWAEFARRYNGPGYRKNHYDTRLASEYNNYQPWEAIA